MVVQKIVLGLFSLMASIGLAGKDPTIAEEKKSPKWIVIFADINGKAKPGIQTVVGAMQNSDWKEKAPKQNCEYPEKAFWAKIDEASIKKIKGGDFDYDLAKLAQAAAKAYLEKEKIDVTQYSGIFIIHDLANQKEHMQYLSVRLANKEPTSIYFLNWQHYVDRP